MGFVQKVAAVCKKGVSAAKLIWRRHGSTIMIVGGSVSVVAGTVHACKATLKVDETLKKREDEKDRIEKLHTGEYVLDGGAVYTDEMYRRELAKVKAGTALDLAKLYLPASLFMVGGLTMIGSGHHMDKRELASSVAVSAAIKKSFDDYREKVKARYGEEEEEKIYHGVTEKVEDVAVISEDGKKKVEVVKTYVANGLPSAYARYYDQTNPNWRGREDYDFVFLKHLQNGLNDLFYMNYGYLLLNTAYQNGGWEPTKAGQRAGWVNSADGTTDGYIDLGIFDRTTGRPKQWALDMYRKEGRVPVDFNVDGDVIERLPLSEI